MMNKATVHDPFFQRHIIAVCGFGFSFVSSVLLALFDLFSFSYALFAYFFVVLLGEIFGLAQKTDYLDPEKLFIEQGVSVHDFKRYIASKKKWRVLTFVCGTIGGTLAAALEQSFPLHMWAICLVLWSSYPLARIYFFKIPNPKLKVTFYWKPMTDEDWKNVPGGPYQNIPGTLAYNMAHPLQSYLPRWPS